MDKMAGGIQTGSIYVTHIDLSLQTRKVQNCNGYSNVTRSKYLIELMGLMHDQTGRGKSTSELVATNFS